MQKNKSNRVSTVAALFSMLGILTSVVVIVYAVVLNNLSSPVYGGEVILGIVELVVCVLFLAGLSTRKDGLPRVLSLIITILLLIFSFFFACVEGTLVSVGSTLVITKVLFFVVSILLLIDAIFQLIYYLSRKNNFKFYLFSNYIFLGLVVCLLGVSIADTFVSYAALVEAGTAEGYLIPIHQYALIITLFFVSAIPALVISKDALNEEQKEEPKAEIEEAAEEEPKAE